MASKSSTIVCKGILYILVTVIIMESTCTCMLRPSIVNSDTHTHGTYPSNTPWVKVTIGEDNIGSRGNS